MTEASESEYNTYGVKDVVIPTGSNQQAATIASQRPSPQQERVVQAAVLFVPVPVEPSCNTTRSSAGQVGDRRDATTSPRSPRQQRLPWR